LVRDRSNAVDGLEPVGTWTITGSATRAATARQASPVALSSATAHVSSQSVLLTFTGAVDAVVANDAARYEVQVNGQTVSVLSTQYSAATNAITLKMAPNILRVGHRVVVCWKYLRDRNSAVLSGCTGSLTAR